MSGCFIAVTLPEATPPGPAKSSLGEDYAPEGSLLGFKKVEDYWDKDEEATIFREVSSLPTERKMNEFDQYCFLVVYPTGYHSGEIDRIRVEIKNQFLRSICRRIIGNHEGISWGSIQLRINPIVFFQYYTRLSDSLQSLRSQSPEPAGVDQLQLLLSFTRTEFSDRFRELSELISRGEITFQLLKCIFLPDTILYARCRLTGEPRALRLVDIEHVKERNMQPEYWKIEAAYVEAAGDRGTSGSRFGHAQLNFCIGHFQGVVAIHTLPAYPLNLHPNEPEVRELLIRRGRVWEALQGVLHKRYDGVAYNNENPPRPVLVNSRIMLDRKLYGGMARDPPPDFARHSHFHWNLNQHDDMDVFSDPYRLFSDSLSDEDATLTPAFVYGFSLEDKQWLKFNVDHVTEIDWRDQAFDSLVLPPSQKELIKGLVDVQAAESAKFDDFIEGKGRGLVLNLFGPPGVGKTLSAEATSEHLRRPLYVVGAGDLGTSPSDLDHALTRIFRLSSVWRAVVLIDEADVYMEQRSPHDMARNALVSVFLRQIEYFAGILFLTTNRVRVFDEAFQSRIHLSLRYYELDASARALLWHRFIYKVGGELSPAEQDTLVALRLNGRQIKNVVKTAEAVASSCGKKVSYGHIKEVVDVMQEFETGYRVPRMLRFLRVPTMTEWVLNCRKAFRPLEPAVKGREL